MDLSRKTRDWEVLSSVSLAGGDVVSAAQVVFCFRSPYGTAYFQLLCYGVGIGSPVRFSVGIGGIASGTYTPVHPDRPFSVNDLNGCMGRFTAAGVSWGGASYKLVFISAFGSNVGNLFLSRRVGGLSVSAALSAGYGAMTSAGYWMFLHAE